MRLRPVIAQASRAAPKGERRGGSTHARGDVAGGAHAALLRTAAGRLRWAVSIRCGAAACVAASSLALGAPAGERQEGVVEARLAHGERGRRQRVGVEQAQRLDQGARSFVGGKADGHAVALRMVGHGAHEQLVGATGPLLGLHADLDDRAGELGLERRRGVVGHDAAVVDHGDAVGQPVGLFEVLRRQQHGRPLGDQLADDGPQLGAALDVEAGGGLVEEQHRRALHEGGGDVESPPHAARVGAHRTVGGVAQVEAREQLAARGATSLRRIWASVPMRRRFSAPVRLASTAALWPARPI